MIRHTACDELRWCQYRLNGGNNRENLKTPDDRWKVRLIEEDFHRLMFEAEGG